MANDPFNAAWSTYPSGMTDNKCGNNQSINPADYLAGQAAESPGLNAQCRVSHLITTVTLDVNIGNANLFQFTQQPQNNNYSKNYSKRTRNYFLLRLKKHNRHIGYDDKIIPRWDGHPPTLHRCADVACFSAQIPHVGSVLVHLFCVCPHSLHKWHWLSNPSRT
jgi:hypothetical protein